MILGNSKKKTAGFAVNPENDVSHIGVIEVVRLREEIVGQFNQCALSIVWRIFVRNKKIDITLGLEMHFNDSLTSAAGSASLM